jgi:hypothetical protein
VKLNGRSVPILAALREAGINHRTFYRRMKKGGHSHQVTLDRMLAQC